jgi:hypothetical protein
MKTKILGVLAAWLLAGPTAVDAAALVTSNGAQTAGSNIFASQFNAVGFSLSSAATNVAISAQLVAAGQNTGTAFLTTQIGSGTTLANEIARSTFNFVNGDVQLFSGLLLGPGDYWLVLASTNGSNVGDGIAVGSDVTYQLAPGVTVLEEKFARNSNVFSSYAPASTWTNATSGNRIFSVTGDMALVPEPATVALLGFGLAGVGFGAARRRR